MTYQELVSTDDLSFSVPSKINSNFLARSHLNVASLSASFTAWADDTTGSPKDVYLITTAAATIVCALPDCTTGDAAAGRAVTFMKADAGAGQLDLDPDGSQTINGSAATLAITTQYDYRTLVSDGVEWFVIGNN